MRAWVGWVVLAAATGALLYWYSKQPQFPMLEKTYEVEEPDSLDDLVAAADAGDAEAQFQLGAELAGADESFQSPEPLLWLLKAAEHGHPAAQNEVGIGYAEGHWGLKQDFAEAVKWYRRSAEQGDYIGQFNLAQSYRDGTGVARDESAAADNYMKSAAQGYGASQFNVYLLLREGVGQKRDRFNADRALTASNRNGSGVGEFLDYEIDDRRISSGYGLSTVILHYAAAYRDAGVGARCLALDARSGEVRGFAIDGYDISEMLLAAIAGRSPRFADEPTEMILANIRWSNAGLQAGILRVAALLGDRPAQEALAEIYRSGGGLAADAAEAAYWEDRAARNPVRVRSADCTPPAAVN